MGLTLHRAQATEIPYALSSFLSAAVATETRKCYSDGSFAIKASLLDTLTLSSAELTRQNAVAATGIYLPPTAHSAALALLIRAPCDMATDAYYQELLGVSVTTLLSLHTPLEAYSDCSSAIKRAHQALSAFGPSVGSLRHGPLLLGIRHKGASRTNDSTLHWVPSHPERKKPQHSWTDDDWGIHIADEIAGSADGSPDTTATRVFSCNSTEVHAALTPSGTWQWQEGPTPYNGSLQKRSQAHRFQQYKNTRDMKRIYANEPSRWTQYSSPLMATLTKIKRSSARHKGRRTKHIYDWMAHAHNLAKGSSPAQRRIDSSCKFCGEIETQQHINVACKHPPLVETRLVHRARIENFCMSYRHQHLPLPHRWVIPLVDYIEDHIWSNTQEGGDVWNGRWTPCLLSTLLAEDDRIPVNQPEFKGAMKWLQRFTLLLQDAQRALYGIRHIELLSERRAATAATVIAHRRQRSQTRTRTLYQASKLKYTRPFAPRRKHIPTRLDPGTPTPPLSERLGILTNRWIQHSRCISRVANKTMFKPHPDRPQSKSTKREEHRTPNNPS